jgi:hypothetical protein
MSNARKVTVKAMLNALIIAVRMILSEYLKLILLENHMLSAA